MDKALRQRLRGCRAVLVYGLSDATRQFLEAQKGLPVVGLLDGFETSGERFGYPIVALEAAAPLGAEAIVVVARAASARVIVRRIEDFCRAHDIAVYDVAGRDLLAPAAETILCDHPYFSRTRTELSAAIAAHDVISFDVFDTLVERLVPEPSDVFALLEAKLSLAGFAQARQRAELQLSQGGAPTLAEIYDRVRTALGWDGGKSKRVQAEERALERQLLVPRPGMAALVKEAKAQGKTVVLLTDMYLPPAWIASMLEEVCGLTQGEGYDAIFVSCACGTTKRAALFDRCRAQLPAASYLHIGDDADADEAAARAHGWDAFRILRAAELARISAWRAPFEAAETLPERLLAGALCHARFGDPFALAGTDGRPAISDGRALGFSVFGPMMIGFFYWVLQQTRGRQDTVLWGARDGYLFARMHERLHEKLLEAARADLPRSVYFYTSRVAAMVWTLRTERDVRALARVAFSGTMEDMLGVRFHLAASERLPREADETDAAYLLRHVPRILARAEELQANAGRYAASLGPLGARLAFVDLVSTGSCHLAAEALLGTRMEGCYLVHVRDDAPQKAALACQAYLETGAWPELATALARNYAPFETVAMSGEPTLEAFDAEGHPLFCEELRTAADLAYVRDVQAGILELFETTLPWADVFLHAPIRPRFADAMYRCLGRNRTRIERCPLPEMLVSDDFMHRVIQMKDMFDDD